MKTKLILSLLTLVIFGTAHNAAAAHNAQRKITVQVNQEKKVAGTQLTVKFAALIEDSRCPVDTRCIQAGNAKLQIEVKKANGAWKTFELNSNDQPQSIVFENYQIKLLDVDPKLRSNVRINRNAYTTTMIVSRLKK